MTRIRRQRGVTLLVSLIMLLLLTLVALSAFNTSTMNLRVVGNMQARNEALYTGQQAIEAAISTPLFTSNPGNALPEPCDAGPNTVCADASGNFVSNAANSAYVIRLNPQPACVIVRSIKSQELDLANPQDVPCLVGQQQQFGVAGGVTGDSLCANSVWEITAQSAATGGVATATLTEGVGIRISADDMATSCL